MYWPKGCSRTRRGNRAGSGLHMAGDAARGALRFCAIGANGVMRLSGENRRSGHLALCVGGSCRHQSSVAICSTSTQAVPESLAQTCSDQRRWGAACQRPFGASWRIYNACNSSCCFPLHSHNLGSKFVAWSPLVVPVPHDGRAGDIQLSGEFGACPAGFDEALDFLVRGHGVTVA